MHSFDALSTTPLSTTPTSERVSQFVAEALVADTPNLVQAQLVAQALLANSPGFQAQQVVVEVLQVPASLNYALSQIVVEVLNNPGGVDMELQQIVVEVLANTPYALPVPPVSTTWYTRAVVSRTREAIWNVNIKYCAVPGFYFTQPCQLVPGWNPFVSRTVSTTWNMDLGYAPDAIFGEHNTNFGYLAFGVSPHVGRGASTTWDVESAYKFDAIYADRNTNYGLILYGMVPIVGVAAETTWNVADPNPTVSDTRSTTWNVVGHATKSCSTTWNVEIHQVGDDRSTTWNVRFPPTRITREHVDVLSNVDSAGRITRSHTDVITEVASSVRITRENVDVLTINSPPTRLTKEWVDVLFKPPLVASKTCSTTWNVEITHVGDDRDTTWNVIAHVGDDRDTTWNLGGYVVVNRDTTWNVEIHHVGDDRDTTWNVIGAVGDDRSTTWNTGGPINVERSTTWNLACVLPHSTRVKLWLMADQGITKDGLDGVSNWEDRSGNGHDAFQSSTFSRPMWVDNQLNGLPVIRFDGTTDWLRVTDSEYIIFGSYVFFCLIKDSRTDSIQRDIFNNADSDNITNAVFMSTVTLTGELTTAAKLTNFFGGANDPNGNTLGYGTLPTDEYFILTGETQYFNGMAWHPFLYKNDTLFASDSEHEITGRDFSQPYAIGRRGTFFSQNYWHGDIAEIIFYEQPSFVNFTNSERQQVFDYLKEKWFDLTSVGLTSSSTTWNVLHLPTVSQQASTTWNADHFPYVTTNTIWAVFRNAPVLVNNSAQAIWDVVGHASRSRDTLWNILHYPSVNKAVDTTWNTLHRPTTVVNRDTTWFVNKFSSTDETATTWRVRRVRVKNRTATWNILLDLEVTHDTTWNSNNFVSITRDTTWNYRQTVTKIAFPRIVEIEALIEVPGERSRWDVENDADVDPFNLIANLQQYSEWDVKISVGTSASTTWNTQAHVSRTRTTTWNDRFVIPGPIQRSTTWKVRAKVGRTRNTRWFVFHLGLLRLIRWNTLTDLSKSAVAKWVTISYNNNTSNTTWNVRTTIASNPRSTTWNVLPPPVFVNRDTTWGIGSHLRFGPLQTLWNIRRNRPKVRTTYWNVDDPQIFCHDPPDNQRIRIEMHVRWNVVGSLHPKKKRATRWNVRISAAGGTGGTGNRNVSTYWRIHKNVGKTSSPTTWRVAKFTTGTGLYPTTWDVHTKPSRQRKVQWNVRNQGPVMQRIAEWDTHALVNQTIEATWIAFIRIKSGNSKWNVRQLATKTADTSWNVRELATPDSREAIWDVRVVVGTESTVGTAKISIWDVKGVGGGANRAKATSWEVKSVGGGASRARTAIWGRSGIHSVTKARNTIWDVKGVGGGANAIRTAVWDTKAGGGVARVTFWNIKGFTRTALWNVMITSNKTDEAIWNVMITSSKTDEAIWNVMTVANESNSTTWTTRAVASKQIATSWDYSTVGTSVATSWGVKRIAKPDTYGIATLWNVFPPCSSQIVKNEPCSPAKQDCPTDALLPKITVCDIERLEKKTGWRNRFIK